MPLVFNYSANAEEFYRNALSVNEFNSQRLIEHSEMLSLDKGRLVFTNWCFDGFRFGHSVLTQEEPFTYHVKNDLDAIKIYFSSKGPTEFNYRQLHKKVAVGSGEFNMLYSAELDTAMTHKQEVSELFSLQFTRECFFELVRDADYQIDEFLAKILEDQPAFFSNHWLPINAGIEKCIDDIINCPFTGDLKKLYLRSQAIELFVWVIQMRQSGPKQEQAPRIPRTDREKLYFVRDYIMENAFQPLQLASLSRMSGLNEYKLKSGFKELFKTSVIDFLINYRLEKARLMMIQQQLPVGEIAYLTGYSSPQYFIRAFKKRFGCTPGSMSRS
jgi:AraC family transcriptional regulator, transcriptional activator of the genes for pyochelin and ferripyochelin receptors